MTEPHPITGDVVLAGEVLQLGIGAMIEAEREGGIRIPVMLFEAEMQGGLGVTDVVLLIWAARLHEFPRNAHPGERQEWEIEDAAAFVQSVGFNAAAIAVRDLCRAAFPSAEGNAPGRSRKGRKASTG